ncbi:MAG TPA: thioredoxin [Tepidisphaeraceae bacterium]|nr:thioredoxin [Tepidisphaeraceae bacterium]
MSIITCPNCGAKNRVDESRASGGKPICGRCKRELPVASSSEPLVLNDQTFDAAVKTAGDKPMLVDCWAAWCGPCRMLGPTMEQIAAESAGRWVIAKLNTDENPRTASRFKIDALPTMLVFRNGNMVDALVGLQPKAAIVERLLAHSV